MAGVGLGLIKKLLTDPVYSFASMAEDDIGLESFDSGEQEVYNFFMDHFTLHGVLPQIRTVEAECEVSFNNYPSDESASYWVTKIVNRNETKSLVTGGSEVMKLAREGKLDEARGELRRVLLELELQRPTTRIFTLHDQIDTVLTGHDVRQVQGDLGGIPFGMPYIDYVSDGAQPGDTVALCGRPGIGKSYFLLRMALSSHQQGKRTLVMTMEMSPEQCARRCIALHTSIPATLIRKGQLSHWGRNELTRKVQTLHALGDNPFYLLGGSLTSTVEELIIQVRELQPDALYVDGAYLLKSGSGTGSKWEQVSYTAEMLKMIATEFGIPVIATYQFNRKGSGKLDNIGLSDAIGQLASIVLSIEEDTDRQAEGMISLQVWKILNLIKGREGEFGSVRMLYDMQRMLIQEDSIIDGARDDFQGDDRFGDPSFATGREFSPEQIRRRDEQGLSTGQISNNQDDGGIE